MWRGGEGSVTLARRREALWRDDGVQGTMTRSRPVIGACVLLAVTFGGVSSADARPCPPMKPPAQVMRDGYGVFEGVVVDRWNEIVADPSSQPPYRRTLRRLRSYRFHVLRDWTAWSPEVTLTHGWYEGTPYWEGTYPTYRLGERYLVFSVLHDSPGHHFSSSCLPGATGDAIPALAAQLGPPRGTYGLPQPATMPFWQQPVRRAREYRGALLALIMKAVD
jgi:hypothetical protein